MMLNYYPETDSLYIDLSPNPSVGAALYLMGSFWIMMKPEI